VPRILSAIAFLDCEPVAEQLAGDHWIVIARVHDLLANHDREPLIFSNGRLGSFVDLEAQEP
jgi:3-hydroxy-9,10-secoandrosta-1,3,5(10)-triene-9,17-dione monooxygenase reductase component